ncbi:MAG: hypothetical protein ACO3V5_05440, partial [Ilumatobacteraceae bacterium]
AGDCGGLVAIDVSSSFPALPPTRDRLVTVNGPGPSGRLDEVHARVGHGGVVPQGHHATGVLRTNGASVCV